ncbi:MAG: AbrB family transcriptional regulator [Clostridiales bacterium GWF2_36_10]|nr:MAG: AbrB family transcriptional regulator [Clostridiales bacterium GWF2_36_10]HAN21368.1 AbrB family transcriptional regulator [Clostridiales bacterium]
MKSTGIVRRVDEFGRISLPVEMRKTMGLEEKSPVEFFVDGNTIVIKKYSPSCVFCGETETVVEYLGRLVCTNCIKTLSELQK